MVLSDRFALTTEAYQMAGRGLDPALVRAGNQAATQGLPPDLTLILDLDTGAGPGSTGRGREAAGPTRTGKRRIFIAGSLAYYLAVQGEGVRHLDGTAPAGPALAGSMGGGPHGRPGNFPGAGRVKHIRRCDLGPRSFPASGWGGREDLVTDSNRNDFSYSAGVEENMKQRWGVIGLVAVISFFSGGWLLQRGVASDGNVYQQARLFDDVLGHVSTYYVDSIGETDLYQKATRGMLEQLKDPYSVLLTGDDYKALTEQTSGNYAGLGIQIDVRDGWITVVAPLPETPADRAGIETGDQIIEVDGKSTEGWKNDEAVKALRGEAGSKVGITIRRAGIPEPIKYRLTRAQIHMRSVPPGRCSMVGSATSPSIR